MESESLMRWPDLLILAAGFVLFLYMGAFFSKKNSSSETYFLAGRNMPGWVVGFSVMATLISSMSFLATPGFAYIENWRQFIPTAGFIIATVVAIFLFMPFFRMGHVSSAYEYLEKRFGAWARFYAAAAFLLIQVARVGVILYALSLAVQRMTGWDMTVTIFVIGAVAAAYTIAGGLEAVIWTDVIQGIALVIGAFICLPILVHQLPGGFGQLFEVAAAHEKFSLGDMSWDFSKIKSFWVMLVICPFGWLQIMCTDQSMIQRYCAPKSRREARKSLLQGLLMSIPLWLYFFFIGTALFVFYRVVPGKSVGDLVAPEQILPHFILTEVPSGLAGFVMLGIIAAGMSTLDSLINATASTVTHDYYRRLIVRGREDLHYLRAGRWFSILFAVIMILTALLIHLTNTTTLNDLQTYAYSIFGGGLLGLFLLGLLTKSVDSRTAAIATILTFATSFLWTFLSTPLAGRLFPAIQGHVPSTALISAVSNVLMFSIGFLVMRISGWRSGKDLTNLTVWSTDSSLKEVE